MTGAGGGAPGNGSAGGLTIRTGDLGRQHANVATGRIHRVVVVREAMPIVFVPGIMGSRLAKGGANGAEGEKVWDPDDTYFMVTKYTSVLSSNAAGKKQRLVGAQFDEDRLVPSLNDSDHNASIKLTAEQIKRGWGSISWGDYGPVLRALASEGLGGRVAKLGNALMLHTPVYAFGYNWTASSRTSGAKLAKLVSDAVQEQRAAGYECRGAVIVTHSMGGLVARAACVLHNAQGLVLGVVHGVQPATGSAAAYWRMRGGFPITGDTTWEKLKNLKANAAALTLGRDGREVTALLGNMPGGLELLPNQLYRATRASERPRGPAADGGDQHWLFWPGTDGREVALPRRGDPYKEIYTERNEPWRLVEDPSWLDPGRPTPSARSAPRGVGRTSVSSPWDSYLERIASVQAFHNELAAKQHPRSAHFYGTGVPTSATVRTEVTLVHDLPADVQNTLWERIGPREGSAIERRIFGVATGRAAPSVAEGCAQLNNEQATAKTYVQWSPTPVNGSLAYPLWKDATSADRLQLTAPLRRVELARAADDGDGTVPTSSGSALCSAATEGARAFAGLEHQPAYQNTGVHAWALDRVAGMARLRSGQAAGGTPAVGAGR